MERVWFWFGQGRNWGSYKKLLPALELFPHSDIVTVDDDTIYGARMIEDFLTQSLGQSGAIVGSRGTLVPPLKEDASLEAYVSWPRATATTTGNIFLTGHGGILYPGGVFDGTPILDQQLASKHCPNQDDIWFWAMANLAGIDRVVTTSAHYFHVPVKKNEQGLFQENERPTGNDAGLAKVISLFDFGKQIR